MNLSGQSIQDDNIALENRSDGSQRLIVIKTEKPFCAHVL